MALDATTQISVTLRNGTFNVWDLGTGEERGAGRVREKFGKDRNANYAESLWLCAWTDRQAIALGLLGDVIAAGTTTQYYLAAAYPDFTTFVCDFVEISGDGIASVGPHGRIAFERARLRIHYAIPPYASGSPEALGELSLDFSSNAIALDQVAPSFKWTSDGAVLPPSAVPALRYTTILFNFTRYRLSALPIQTIQGLVDHSNSDSIFGAAPEQMTLRGARSSTTYTPNGNPSWTVSYAMEYNANGWNQAYRPGSGWAPFTDLGGNKLYPLAAFSPLIS